MARPNRELANSIMTELSVGSHKVEEITKGLKKKDKASPSKRRYYKKLKEGRLGDFDKADWLHYWMDKAEEQGVYYRIGNYAKEYSILGCLMKTFTPQEVKAMMDFVFESNQDIHDKNTVGLWILSKGWVNTIYQNAILWTKGKYIPRSEAKEKYTAPKRNREWTGEVTEKTTVVDTSKRIKKGSITF